MESGLLLERTASCLHQMRPKDPTAIMGIVNNWPLLIHPQ
jgi:hypothetical protein